MNKFAEDILNSTTCNVCPRKCNANRNNELGYCHAPEQMHIAKIMVHMWEEPILTNVYNENCEKTPKGSGAIFFSNCNLKCIYCQNYEISNQNCGKCVSPKELVEIFKDFEKKNVCNINLVTPTHYVKQIIKALSIYKPKIPVVYNTSGYENEETINALSGLIDIFLFDFKYYSQKNAKDYSNAPNYPEICKNAILTAKKQIKNDILENGIMKKGIIIRHLLLPNASDDGIKILDFIASNLSVNTYVSLLNQYTPLHKALPHPVLKNRPTKLEYKRLIVHAKKLGMENVFCQDETSATTNFVPNFNNFNEE